MKQTPRRCMLLVPCQQCPAPYMRQLMPVAASKHTRSLKGTSKCLVFSLKNMWFPKSLTRWSLQNLEPNSGLVRRQPFEINNYKPLENEAGWRHLQLAAATKILFRRNARECVNTLRRTFEYAISMVLGVDYVALCVACSKCRIKKNQD